MSSHLTKINSQQRFDMIDRGMNPLNPEHVNRYLRGNVKADMNENVERIKAIMGEDLTRNLGHARESERAIQPGEYTPSSGSPAVQNDIKSIKENMLREMDETAPTGLMDFNMSSVNRQAPRPQQNNQVKLDEARQVGKQLATNYYNAFIKSLQEKSTTSYLNVFKAVKAMLEQEKALAGSNLLPYYQDSVKQITEAMYSKITKKLHD